MPVPTGSGCCRWSTGWKRRAFATWIDREGIHGGANYAQVINDAIQGSAALLLCRLPGIRWPPATSSRNWPSAGATRSPTCRCCWTLSRSRASSPTGWKARSGSRCLIDLRRLGSVMSPKHCMPLGIIVQLPLHHQSATPTQARPLLVGREREQGSAARASRPDAGGAGRDHPGRRRSRHRQDDAGRGPEHRGGRAGALVLWGHAYDLSVTPPYGPWLEIFRQYRSVADSVAAVAPRPSSGMRRNWPRSARRTRSLSPWRSSSLAVAAQRPLMLVLDDLHWVDQASLDFFRFLARQVASMRDSAGRNLSLR